jgi:predicted nucleic-acid-binding protein
VEDIKWVVIDTNLLVRYLTDDEPQKAKAVDNLLKKAANGELRILIPSIVIAELVWVLESFYRMEANEIAGLVEAILNTPGIEVTEKSIIISALRFYTGKNIDFIDAWIIEFAKKNDIKTIYTFDKRHFRDIEEIEIKNPL